MELNSEQRAKADHFLQKFLDDSSTDEVLQVVMVLDDDNTNSSTTETLKPSQFSSRVEYRQALINRRKQQLETGTVGQTIEALNNLDLTIHGGKASRFLVVEGTATEIMKSLSLSGVKSATLDQIIRIEPTPIDPKTVEYFSNLILEIVSGDKDKIFPIAKQYISNYYKSYGQLKVLGMRNPTQLEDIYTTVKVLPGKLIRQLCYDDEIKENFKKKQEFHHNKQIKKLTGIDVANKYQFLTVLGAPGSGKSTLLRKVGLDSLKGDLDNKCIPILIELKQFNNLQDIDLLTTIKAIFRDYNFPKINEFISEGLKQGKFIILLDGLDEVSKKIVNKVVEEARELVKNNQKNRFIISCRTAAYQQYFKKFNSVIIADFDNIQIEDFVNNWFSSETDQRAETAKKCLQALEKNPGTKELAKTPLLLTFICLVYDKSQTLPKNRSELYKRALEILLEEWSGEKKLERDPIYKNFTTKLEIMLLSEIAYEGFVEDKLFFKTQELVDKITTFLSKNLNASQDLDGKAVLNAIAIQQGILVERLDNVYSFSHLTLQEYLTAKYIVDNDLIAETINSHVTDKRWKEVFILIAGLIPGKKKPDQLLLGMETKALSYLKSLPNNHYFLELLEWVERKTENSPANLKPVAKRVIGIAYVYAYVNVYASTNASNNANAYSNTYTNIYSKANTRVYPKANTQDNAYVIKFFIECIKRMKTQSPLFSDVDLKKLKKKLETMNRIKPNQAESRKVHKNFAKRLLETWLSAFDLTLDMINLSRKKSRKLDQNYFYVYNLILDCKNAAEFVNDETWEGIEERMYTVPKPK